MEIKSTPTPILGQMIPGSGGRIMRDFLQNPTRGAFAPAGAPIIGMAKEAVRVRRISGGSFEYKQGFSDPGYPFKLSTKHLDVALLCIRQGNVTFSPLDSYDIILYNLTCYAGVAQLFRAFPCQGRGPGLESLYPHQEIIYWHLRTHPRVLLVCKWLLTPYERCHYMGEL